ncbi:MAG TPA: hypothetical protein VJH75_01470 [Patescibacteria group bacterium]|nr:hypothetical protein [Patescibacteria group bacterium]
MLYTNFNTFDGDEDKDVLDGGTLGNDDNDTDGDGDEEKDKDADDIDDDTEDDM